MNSRQFSWILSNDKVTSRNFKGVYALDEIVHIKQKSFPSAYVFNLDPSYKPGSHWVAVYINRNGLTEYFDSFGHPQPREIKDVLSTYAENWNYNHVAECSRTLFYDMWTICCVLYLSKMFWFKGNLRSKKNVKLK